MPSTRYLIMQISRIRGTLSLVAAFGSGAAVYGLLGGYSWAIYLAVAVGYTTGVCCMGWQAGLVGRCLRPGIWQQMALIHAMFVAAVVMLVRIDLYGGANLPPWLTSSYVTYGRSGVPRASSLLTKAVGVAVIALIFIEAFWVRRRFRPESDDTVQ